MYYKDLSKFEENLTLIQLLGSCSNTFNIFIRIKYKSSQKVSIFEIKYQQKPFEWWSFNNLHCVATHFTKIFYDFINWYIIIIKSLSITYESQIVYIKKKLFVLVITDTFLYNPFVVQHILSHFTFIIIIVILIIIWKMEKN